MDEDVERQALRSLTIATLVNSGAIVVLLVAVVLLAFLK